MYYIIGLGNPGARYARTRHNVGWMVLDELTRRLTSSTKEMYKYWNAELVNAQIGSEPVCLVYPQTYMNRSGETVRRILCDEPDASIVMVHDDVAISLGAARLTKGRGHAGHNGVRSVYEQTKRSDFLRVRVGIAPVEVFRGRTRSIAGDELQRHVLGTFGWFEQRACTVGVDLASRMVSHLCIHGITATMNEFN
jgi:PTH1 family peptidyl-tRNA hydrolase